MTVALKHQCTGDTFLRAGLSNDRFLIALIAAINFLTARVYGILTQVVRYR